MGNVITATIRQIFALCGVQEGRILEVGKQCRENFLSSFNDTALEGGQEFGGKVRVKLGQPFNYPFKNLLKMRIS